MAGTGGAAEIANKTQCMTESKSSMEGTAKVAVDRFKVIKSYG